MSVIWSGITEEGAVVPVQVTAEGKVVAEGGGGFAGSGAAAWASLQSEGTGVESGTNIESCVRLQKGKYRVEFIDELVNATYCVVASASVRVAGTKDRETTGFTLELYSKGGDAPVADMTSDGASIVVFCDGVAPSLLDKASARIDAVRDEFAEATDPTTLPSFPDSESEVIVTPDNDNA